MFDKKFTACKKILGILGYTKKSLLNFNKMQRAPFEINNSIDQSRIIENNYTLQGVKFKYGFIGINDKKEKKKVLNILKNDTNQLQILRKIL